jgi:pimeloyl-ACP methyl ester carboxylesterase
MKLYKSFVFAVLTTGYVALSMPLQEVPPDQDVGKDMTEIVTTRGYVIESHNVTTADGYILTMFRIPASRSATNLRAVSGPPVILQHGLLDSSYTWVSNFEDESLGYILADKGFDVWFGNNRGNRYGRHHLSKDPDDKSSGFWDFTWDDMASYDVPAMINYVTDLTGYPTVGWVGHSEGTIQMFAAGTSLETNNNDYFQKAMKSINVFAALAPVAYVDNLKTKLLVDLAHTNLPQRLYDRGYLEFLPYGPLETIAPEICQTIEKGCDVLFDSLFGPSLNLNASRIQVYVSETPAGTSTMNIMHWAQGVLYPNFQKFDWGSAEANQQHYGQDTPPQYDLGKLAVSSAYCCVGLTLVGFTEPRLMYHLLFAVS